MEGKRIFGNNPEWKAPVPDFSTASAGEVTDNAPKFVMPNAPDFSKAPASVATKRPVDTFTFGPKIEEGEK